MKSDDLEKTAIILIGFLIIALSVFLIFFSAGDIEVPRILQMESSLAQLGAPTDKFDGLLTKITDDLGRKDIKIKVMIGPYFRYAGITGMLDTSYQSYSILIDNEFYDELNDGERDALVAHEAGHIIFMTSLFAGRKESVETQKKADAFAARYVHPQYVASLLDKVYTEYLARREQVEQLMRDR